MKINQPNFSINTVKASSWNDYSLDNVGGGLLEKALCTSQAAALKQLMCLSHLWIVIFPVLLFGSLIMQNFDNVLGKWNHYSLCDICLKIIPLAQTWPFLRRAKRWSVSLGKVFKGRRLWLFDCRAGKPLPDYTALSGFCFFCFMWSYMWWSSWYLGPSCTWPPSLSSPSPYFGLIVNSFLVSER